MPADPAIPTPVIPTSVPPVTSTTPAEADLDPDALDDEDFREEQKDQRPEDWNEPPSPEAVPKPDQPTPLSDDLR